MLNKRRQQILEDRKQAGGWQLNQQVRERELSFWGARGKCMVAQTQERGGNERHQEVRSPGLGWKHRIVLQACKKRLDPPGPHYSHGQSQAYLWREWTWVALDSPKPGRAQEMVLNQESTYPTMRPTFPSSACRQVCNRRLHSTPPQPRRSLEDSLLWGKLISLREKAFRYWKMEVSQWNCQKPKGKPSIYKSLCIQI